MPVMVVVVVVAAAMVMEVLSDLPPSTVVTHLDLFRQLSSLPVVDGVMMAELVVVVVVTVVVIPRPDPYTSTVVVPAVPHQGCGRVVGGGLSRSELFLKVFLGGGGC